MGGYGQIPPVGGARERRVVRVKLAENSRENLLVAYKYSFLPEKFIFLLTLQ